MNISCHNALPFTVECLHPSSPTQLTCTLLVRSLPKKRLTCQALWDGKKVLAKIFFPKARAAFQKEYHNTRRLIESGIPSQTILWAGKGVWLTPLYVLIYAFKEDAKTFKEAWREAPLSQKAILFPLLLKTLARLHQQGIVQTDFHLANFLTHNREIQIIDTATLRFLSRPLKRSEVLFELGVLLAQFPSAEDEWILGMLSPYFQERGWTLPEAFEEKKIIELREKWHARICRNHLKKIFRNTSRFQCIKNWKRTIVWDKNLMSPTLLAFLENPTSFLHHRFGEIEILKKASSRTTLKLHNAHPLFIKQYRHKSLLDFLRSPGTFSKAGMSWRNAHRLISYGFSTPRPVAYFQYRLGLFKGMAYFAAEKINAQSIWEPLTTGEPHTVQKIIQAVCHGLARMKKFRLSHGDLKISNILWSPKGEMVLVDLDNMRQHRWEWTFKRAFALDIQRFLRNLTQTPHHELFLKAFKKKGLI
ncbi:MAG: hypothetical protein HY559_05015 [Gammaproteobacteria bacterium]|nr:hypothetical protein [Gammaproteobacteria bacterium]